MERKKQLLACILAFVLMFSCMPAISISAMDYTISSVGSECKLPDNGTFRPGDTIKNTQGDPMNIYYFQDNDTYNVFTSSHQDSVAANAQYVVSGASAAGVTAPAGKRFKNWTVAYVYASGGTPSQVDLIANWENVYKVTYAVNNGTGSTIVDSTSYAAGEPVPLTKTLSRANYQFVGWAESPSATDKLTTYAMPSNNVTLYAVWKAIPVQSIAVSSTSTSVQNGSTLQMATTVLPSDATNHSVTWSVAKGTGSATISPTGVLTGTSVGTVTVKATANDGSGISGQTTITVTPILVDSIAVTPANGSVQNGSTLQMGTTVLPTDATDSSVTWSVAKGTGSATISITGLLTATSVGTVTVKATASDGSGKSGETTITVTAIPVQSISVTPANGSVQNGSTLQMGTTVLPANATNSSVTWSVTDGTGSATISPTGELTGTSVGTVTVKATANDGSGVSGETIITVTAIPVKSIPVQSISVTPANGSVQNGSTLQMVKSVLPANATDSTVTWSVANGTGTATIDASGLLTGTGVGTVTVKATAKDGSGISGETTITITAIPVKSIPVQSISVTPANGSVQNGSTLQMVKSVLPANATDSTVTWSAANGTGTATIDASGLLTGTGVGTVTVKATAKDGSGISGETTITITAIPVKSIPVQSISVTPANGSVQNGSTLQMTKSVLPANATDSGVTWSVTKGTGTATIDANGLLTGTSVGTVTVKATAKDGSGISGETNITITEVSSGGSDDSSDDSSDDVLPIPNSKDTKSETDKNKSNDTSDEIYTTAVVKEGEFTGRHLPTYVTENSGGKFDYKVTNLENIDYVLVKGPTATFDDLQEHWAKKAIYECASRKIIEGVGNKLFEPDRGITRAEFAAIIIRGLGLMPQKKSVFTDVDISAWYYSEVATAYTYGIVLGDSKDKFNPDKNITREEAMAMIQRAAKIVKMDTTSIANISSFSDVNEISAWALESVKFNIENKLIVGRDNSAICPKNDITRAETVTIIMRLLQKAKLIDSRVQKY